MYSPPHEECDVPHSPTSGVPDIAPSNLRPEFDSVHSELNTAYFRNHESLAKGVMAAHRLKIRSNSAIC